MDLGTTLNYDDARNILNATEERLNNPDLDEARKRAPPTVKLFQKLGVSRGSISNVIGNMTDVEVKKRLTHDLNFFAHFFLGDSFKYDFPFLFLMLWELLVKTVASMQDYVGIANLVLGIPRGFAKTTFMKLYVIYCMLFTRHTFVVVVGNIEKNASNILKDLEAMLDQPHVRRYFGDYDAKVVTNQADFKYFFFYGQWCILRSKGGLTSLRGLNVNNRRPDIILMDDVQDEENAKSELESAALKDWILNTLLNTKSPDGSINLYVGNTYAHKGAILTQLTKDPEWVSLVLGAILEDGTSLWPELHPVDMLLSGYRSAVRNGSDAAWLAEFMNAMDSSKNIRFDATLMRKYYNDLSIVSKTLVEDGYNVSGKCIVIDPSSTKKSADEHAIALGYTVDGTSIIRKVIHGAMTPKQAIRTALILALKENCFIIYVEDVAYQDTLLYWFNETLAVLTLPSEVKKLIKVLPVSPNNKSKHSRIMQLFKQLNSGELIIHPDAQSSVKAEAMAYDPLRSNNVDNVLDVCHYAHKVMVTSQAYIKASYEQTMGIHAKMIFIPNTHLPV